MVYVGYAILPSNSKKSESNSTPLNNSFSPEKTQSVPVQTSRSKFLRICLAGSSKEFQITDPKAIHHIPSLFDGPFDTRSPSVAAKVSREISLMESSVDNADNDEQPT
jgi:hypothetical protein